ncbi:uncharacterized protein LOC34617529 [Cyclospora cayetanensis]|uniref:SURF1-like protein n=1 Tax=Cyclospora cayetanensis TaxID=88456 RepID=A0A6P6RSQ3_9EIME|nr:uncharacterized protein LOC34617529 [Cyclospora cayetanensis]
MPGQRLLPCTPEDAAILSKSETKYPSPQEVDGGIIVRIIAAKDAHRVSSPVLRVVRNRQYGIRKGERLRLALGGGLFTSVLVALGFWQLRRMEEKKQLIEYRRSHLATQPTVVTSSPFPWTLKAAAYSKERRHQTEVAAESASHIQPDAHVAEPASASSGVYASHRKTLGTSLVNHALDDNLDIVQHQEGAAGPVGTKGHRSGHLLAAASEDAIEAAVASWAYTPVVLHGVLDSTTELLVGPRPGLEVGTPGYCVVSPLRLKDGCVILVNKGHLPVKLAKLPPFPKAAIEDNDLFALVRQQQQQLARQKTAAMQQPERQVDEMQQLNSRYQYVDYGAQQRMEQLQLLAGSRTEPVGHVIVRGILEPGEVANSSFKSLMLKNRPHDGQFHVLNPRDLAKATPGIPNRAEAALLMVNAYSIVYDDDVLHQPEADAARTGSSCNVANRFMNYQHKQKADYLLFYADEHTHFNYACQWFLMGLCTAAMTVYKLIEVSRWRW